MIILVLPDDTPDDVLLRQAKQGDKSSMSQIYQRYVDSIYQFARLRVGDPQTAEDITSAVFIRMIDGFARGKGPRTSLRGWLFQVARHAIYDLYGNTPALPIETIDQWMSHETSPEMDVLQAIDREQVQRLIQSLSPDQQEVLLLRFDQQLSLQETADIMGKNINTIKTLQLRAVEKLRKLLNREMSR